MSLKNVILHHIIKKTFIILLPAIGGLFILTSSAMASSTACTQSTPKNYTINVDVPNNAAYLPVGASLTGELSYTQEELVDCPNSGGNLDMYLAGTGQIQGVGTDGRIIYKTNVSGVGIKIGGGGRLFQGNMGNITSDINKWIATSSNPAEWTQNVMKDGSGVDGYIYITPKIELIKTASSIGGGTLSGIVARVYTDNADNIIMYWVLNGEIHASGCIVNSGQDLNITLDDVQKKDLSGVGSTWGQSSAEDIQLTCNKGTNVYVTFTGTQAADSTDASILANNGSAKGLGVQLLNSQGTPYVMGSKVAAVTNSGTSVTIPVSARYIRTGDLSAGSVEASATYTLDYE